MGCSALGLHRSALPLIGRSDAEEWIPYPQGSPEDFAASVLSEVQKTSAEKHGGSPSPASLGEWSYFITGGKCCSPRCVQEAEGKHLHDSTALCSQWLQDETTSLTSEDQTTLRGRLSKGSPRFKAVIAQIQQGLSCGTEARSSDTRGALILGDAWVAVSGFLKKAVLGKAVSPVR